MTDQVYLAHQALRLRSAGKHYADIAAALEGVGDELEARELVALALESRVREDRVVTLQLDEARLEQTLAGLHPKASAGDKSAVDQQLKVMEALRVIRQQLQDLQASRLQPAFPAPPDTPGQPESRTAYQQFIDQREDNPWWETYVQLREKWDWRKAAFIAWSAMPARKRLPRTQEDLAAEVLGLTSTSTIRKWRADDPGIDEAIEQARIAMAGDNLSDVLDAWQTVAAMPVPKAHRDRITFLEWQGVYRGEGLRIGGLDGGPLLPAGQFDLAGDEAEVVITNFLLVAGIQHLEQIGA